MSRELLTDTYSPAAMEIAPAMTPASPAVKITCDESADLIFLDDKYHELKDSSLVLDVVEASVEAYEVLGKTGGFTVERVGSKKPVKSEKSKKAKK